MASYFDDLNIMTTQSQRKKRYDVDLDDFMTPHGSVTSARPEMASTPQLGQLLQTASQFREQMQQGGDHDQEQFLDNLVSQLLEESQSNAKGPPPASQRFINLLPHIKPSALDEDETCIICKDNLKTSDSAVTRMPCGHYFDRECLVPWLELHHTCPLCRSPVESEQQAKEEEEEEARDMMYG
ncbi:hypothetical protein DFQ28_005225 [Apophysomyces sp. BC1034]|nr:hypothetical protein DFQ30_005091 [Apophysomyces sp. BC1015]KAG0177886.1 hypothetical protein DFQ29_004195 [Apophysomyces sp. BC1021]KAG0188215.1 hypothetical protein DFQ28_005225 [Apophysomyces sp. BC1034]